MFKIVNKRKLTDNIYLMDVYAERIAESCYPGQFVIVRVDEKSERIPLTICDYNRGAGTVTIVFQTIGASTKMMATLNVGDHFLNFTGPLGCRSELVDENSAVLTQKRILFAAGGVGTAPVFPQVKWMREHGYQADCIIGTRSKELVILEEEMKQYASNVYVCTDDGSYGFSGNVNDRIKDLVLKQNKHYDKVIAIGPIVMMKYVCMLTRELNIPTVVSMNTIMLDGTGMCGACRLTVGGEVKFACVDGPEFDGHLIDFDEAIKRQNMYKTEEGKARLRELEGNNHQGRCGCGGGR